MKRKRPATPRRHVCNHEAAHAVVAHALGEKVTLISLKRTRGVCEIAPPKSCVYDPMRIGIIALSGALAEADRPRKRPRAWDAGDMGMVISLGFRDSSIGTLAQLAAAQVAINWKAIRRVSRALDVAGELDRKAFLAAMTGGAR